METRPSLLSKVRRGDDEAWNEFYDLHKEWIYAAARAARLSHHESEDVRQETLLTVRNYIAGFVPDASRGKFRTWLRRIVSTRIADQHRKKGRDPLEKVSTGDPSSADSGSTTSTTSTTDRLPDLNDVELDRMVDRELESAVLQKATMLAKQLVTMENYQAYELHDLQQMSARDVAATLGVSSVTVRVRAFRTRQEIHRQARRILAALERTGRPCRDASRAG